MCVSKRSGIWKIKKGPKIWCRRQVFFNEGGNGGWQFSYLFFSKFIIFTFRNYLLYSLQTVLRIWKQKFFFYHHSFMKKRHSRLFKNDPENMPWVKTTWLLIFFVTVFKKSKNWFLIESDSWTGEITLLILIFF